MYINRGVVEPGEKPCGCVADSVYACPVHVTHAQGPQRICTCRCHNAYEAWPSRIADYAEDFDERH